METTTASARMQEIQGQIDALHEELWNLRKEQPGTPIGKDYEFLRSDGSAVKLAELFGANEHLLLIHNMGKSCRYCSLWADGFISVAPLLADQTSFVLVNGDSPEVQREVAATRGWTFPMVSDPTGEFTKDMGMISEEGRWPGVTAFYRSPDGTILRMNQAIFGPGDAFGSIWHFLSLRKGGGNGWEPRP